MIPFVLAVSMMATAQMPAAAQRQQFANCLRQFVNSKVQERMEASAFTAAFAAACQEQETAYRSAYLVAAARVGDSRTRAQQDANLEVEDLRSNFRQLFESSQAE